MGSLEVQQDLMWVFGNGIWSGVYMCVLKWKRYACNSGEGGSVPVGRVSESGYCIRACSLAPSPLKPGGARAGPGGAVFMERLRRSCGHELAGAKSRGHSLRTSLNVPHNMFPPPEITISRDPVGLFGLSPNHRTPCGRCRVPRQRSYVANQ